MNVSNVSANRLPVLAVASAVWSRLGIYTVLILAARNLPPQEFGAFAVLMAASGIISAMTSGGGDMWLNRFTWRSSSMSKQAPRMWRVYLILCASVAVMVLAIAITVTGLAGAMRQWQWADATFIAILSASVAGLAEAMLAILRASGWVRTFFSLRDIIPPVLLVGAFLFAAPTTAVTAVSYYAGVWVIALVVLAMIFLLNAGTLLPVTRVKPNAWRKSITHTALLIYGNLGSRLSTYLDVLALTMIISLADIGEYRVAAQFAIGFMVVQHFTFLGLPWQVRNVGSRGVPGSGLSWVISRQRVLLLSSAAALLVLWFAAELLLSLLGTRFGDDALLLRILLLIRFVELLWGPQHEVLVSRGKVLEDAHANVVAILVWAGAFVLLNGIISPISAAVVANALASASGQGARYVMLRRSDASPTFGHQFGMSLPLACTLGLVAAAGSML